MDTKPLEFIQAIIARMAANSTQMKTWNVALATAAIGYVAARDGKPGAAAFCALFPALAFWLLDGYYLALEFRFRELYSSKVESGAPTYDMKIDAVDLKLLLFAIFRPSVFMVHLPVLGIIFGLVSGTRHSAT